MSRQRIGKFTGIRAFALERGPDSQCIHQQLVRICAIDSSVIVVLYYQTGPRLSGWSHKGCPGHGPWGKKLHIVQTGSGRIRSWRKYHIKWCKVKGVIKKWLLCFSASLFNACPGGMIHDEREARAHVLTIYSQLYWGDHNTLVQWPDSITRLPNDLMLSTSGWIKQFECLPVSHQLSQKRKHTLYFSVSWPIYFCLRNA